MIAFLIITALVTGLAAGAFLGVTFAEEARKLAIRLTRPQGAHSTERGDLAASLAVAPRVPAVEDVRAEGDEVRCLQYPSPGEPAVPDEADRWRGPSIDVYAQFAKAAEAEGLPPARLFAAGRRDVTRADRGTPPAGVLTGPLPAVTDEVTREMYLRPAAAHAYPCCRHCEGGCRVPDVHAIACIGCAPVPAARTPELPAVTGAPGGCTGTTSPHAALAEANTP